MREMKDSGMSWVGNVPKHWLVEKLKYHLYRYEPKNPGDKQVLSVYREYGVIPKDSRDDNHNVTSEDTSKYKYVKPNNLVVNKMKAWQGSMGVSDYEGIVSPAYFIYHFSDKQIIPKYLHYLFRNCYKDEFRRISGGIREGQWDLSPEQFENTMLLIPSIKEQDSIIKTIDAKTIEIDILASDIRTEIDILNEYKRSKTKEIFDYYMNNYDFVYGKLGQLSTLVTKQTGFDYSKTISPSLVGEMREDTIPYLQTRHFKDNYLNLDTEYYIPRKIAEWFPQLILNKKTLLFSIVGASIGNVAVYSGEKEAFLGGAICKVDLKEAKLYDYIKHYMMSTYGQDQILTKINSSAQGTITVQNVRDFRIPIFGEASVHEQIADRITHVSQDMYTIISQKQKQLEVLENYKKAVIYEYVTGKKEVPAL